MYLEDIELHDLPVDAITVNNSQQLVTIECSVYDDVNERYIGRTLQFRGVQKFSCTEVLIYDLNDLEIYDAELRPATQGYEIDIVFLSGTHKVSFTMTIMYKEVVVGSASAHFP